MSECEHKNWVYCRDCGNFINLLTKETINDKGLVRINRGVLCSL
jgi:hypothetical protein